jgi:putative glutamine amidotransferase
MPYTNNTIIGIVCNLRRHEAGIGHTVNKPYVDAIARYTNARPLFLPCLADDQLDSYLDPLLSLVDGILLTGSRTNIHPRLYGQEATPAHEPLDELRDRTSLALARWALDKKVPLLGVCRGLQEINVACSGTLHAAIHEQDGKLDHKTPENQSFDEIHADRHHINVVSGGILAKIFDQSELRVNSLHTQGVDKLGDGLKVEATASDGVIEAISYTDHPFALGVQWHPEHQTGTNEVSAPLFSAFEASMLAFRKTINR